MIASRVVRLLGLLWLCLAPPLAAQQAESPESQAYLLWEEGYHRHLAGAYDEAIALFRRSIEIHPTAEAHTFLGWSLSYRGQLDEAIAECKTAIAIDPDYGNPYNDIGVYLIDLGRPDEAVPWLEQATRAKRYCCYQFPHFNLGRIQLMMGQLTAARRSFERALSYEPSYLPAWQGLAFIRAQGREL
jgi:Tfp pilus assembly protein PilF